MGRQMKTDVTGDDLRYMGVEPGPMIGRILNDLLMAKMDDESLGREEQLALASRLALQYTAEAAARTAPSAPTLSDVVPQLHRKP